MTGTRHEGLDLLRIISMLFVIGIHTSGQYLATPYWENSNAYVASIFQAIVQTGVPLFFMLSGSFLLDQPIPNVRKFYRQKMPRLLIPLILYLPLYYLYFWLKGADVAESARHLYEAKGYFHLWFLIPLIGLYLVTPLLRRLLEWSVSVKEQALEVGLLLFFMIIANIFLYINEEEPSVLTLFIPYIGYYFLGYLLRKHPIKHCTFWWFVYGLSTLGTIILFIVSHDTFWANYPTTNLSPFIALSSTGLFALFAKRPEWHKAGRWLSHFSSLTLGVFLIHIAVLDVVSKPFLMWMPFIMDHAGLSILIRWSITTLISFGIVHYMHKVPWIRRYL